MCNRNTATTRGHCNGDCLIPDRLSKRKRARGWQDAGGTKIVPGILIHAIANFLQSYCGKDLYDPCFQLIQRIYDSKCVGLWLHVINCLWWQNSAIIGRHHKPDCASIPGRTDGPTSRKIKCSLQSRVVPTLPGCPRMLLQTNTPALYRSNFACSQSGPLKNNYFQNASGAKANYKS